VAERVRDEQSRRRTSAEHDHQQDDPQGRRRAGAVPVVAAGRLARRPLERL